MHLDRHDIPAVINARPVGTPTILLYFCDTSDDSSDLTESRPSWHPNSHHSSLAFAITIISACRKQARNTSATRSTHHDASDVSTQPTFPTQTPLSRPPDALAKASSKHNGPLPPTY